MKKYLAPDLEVKSSSLKVVMYESDVELNMGGLLTDGNSANGEE